MLLIAIHVFYAGTAADVRGNFGPDQFHNSSVIYEYDPLTYYPVYTQSRMIDWDWLTKLTIASSRMTSFVHCHHNGFYTERPSDENEAIDAE